MMIIDWFRKRWLEPPDLLLEPDKDEIPMNNARLSGPGQDVAALLNRASAHFSKGDVESGERICRQVLETAATNADTCLAVGQLQLQHGQPAAAEKSFRLVVRLNSDLPAAHFYLASSLRAQNRLEEAAESFKESIRLNPNSPSAHSDLGVTYRNLSLFNEAIASSRRAIEIDPAFAHAHDNLGVALWQSGRVEEAIGSIEKAISLNPTQASFHNNIGIICFEKGDVDRAEAELLESLRLAPDYVDSMVNLAAIYEATYRLDDAWKRIERGLSIVPDHPRLHLCAARCEMRRGEIGNAIDRLKTLSTKNSPAYVQAQIEKELAQLLVRDGQHKQAFEYATKGNKHQREVATAFGIDKQEFLDEIDSVGAWLTRERINSWPLSSELPAANTPVFLVGFPRSGTTLLDQMLDSHPRIQTLEEAASVEAMKAVLKGKPAGYPNSLGSLTRDDMKVLRSAYFEVVDSRLERTPGALLVDKYPLNVCNAALIHRVFPGARFLFALRHPCDVCLSGYMQNFKLNSAMACFLDLGDAVSLYEKSMSLWQQSVDILSLEYHTVRYEDLVVDVRSHIQKVLEFIGVEWDDRVLKHFDHARQRKRIATASLRQVTEPVYNSARYRWHHYEQELSSVLSRLQPFIERFGY